jgi:5-methylcytosine-specific restriction endonuclease McrA
MKRCLEVNAGGIPVGIVSIKAAILAIQNGRAVARASYDGTIRSSGYMGYDLRLVKNGNSVISMPIPSVIQFVNSDYHPKRYTKILPFNRKNVYIRDGGRCAYCNRKVGLGNFTFDHIIPRVEGGIDCWENVVISCVKCNNQKDRMSLRKWGKKLLRKPYAPRLDKAAPSHLVSKIASEIPHETWMDFIYWNVELKE